MASKIFDRLRDLQSFIKQEGLGGTVLSLPAPKMLIIDDARLVSVREEAIFSQVVTEIEIVSVSRDLFESGFFNQSVAEAFKALDKFISKKSGLRKQSGSTLMNNAFSPSNPVLYWSDRTSSSEEDEQRGYHMIFSGGFTAIRNPVTHEIDWISDHSTALDAILLAQHLLRKAKSADVKV
jgi:uncharacterized protein (TIGR02391 family)